MVGFLDVYPILIGWFRGCVLCSKECVQYKTLSPYRILELQSSLYTSKRKMLRLKTKLKREEEYKSSLERELKEDQKRIKELEQKCQSSRVNSIL